MPLTLDGTNIVLNLLTREYETFRNQAIELAQVANPEWTDFYPSDPGVTLLEILAGNADILSYYIDRVYGESHWSTAQLRQSILDMASLINYTPSPASASTVTVACTITGAGVIPGTDSTSAEPFKIGSLATQDQTSFEFELLESYTASGAGTQNLVFIEGSTTFRESLGLSSGRPGITLQIAGSPITTNLDGTPAVRVEAPLGTVWTQVSNFLDSESTDKHYTLRLTAEGRGVLLFGDGINGQIPTGGSEILVTYRTGGGSASNNVGVGKVTRILRTSSIVSGVTNITKPSGGQDVETVERIRSQAPKQWGTQDRAVTHEDYETLARTVNGVYKAKAEWYNGSPLVEAVYIATAGDNPIPTGTWNKRKQRGTGLLGVVGKTLVEKSCTATQIMMLPITPVDVETAMTVTLLPFAYRDNVLTLINSFVRRYVRNEADVAIPTLLSVSGLYAGIEGIQGVDYLKLTSFYRVPYIEEYQVGSADTTWSDVTVAGRIVGQNYRIVFDTPTTFYVEGDVSGLDPLTGTVGTAYTTSDGTLTFTFTAGSIANQPGDTYLILTSDRVGDITIQDKEIPIPGDPVVTFVGGIG